MPAPLPPAARTSQPPVIRPASRSYRTWTSDSSRWHDYHPRPDDIVIATYPKSGTTWMQRIVSLLIFQDTAPRPIGDISVWLDFRLGEPLTARHAKLDSQTHRRFLKSHIPFDGIATFDDVKYIHVARDGRDACLSYHDHNLGFRAETFAGLDAIGFADHRLQAPYPRPAQDPRAFFSNWLNHGVDDDRDGSPFFSWFGFERTFWEVRHQPNVLMVHYADLKSDLAAEMSRIADFLNINVPAELWPELVKAATFAEMKRVGAQLNPVLEHVFENGAQGFFARGENERWRGVLADDDLAAFETKAATMLEPDCATWLANGSLIAGRP